MNEISEILKPLLSIFKKSKLDNLGILVLAILSMSGSKTMLNISRWTKKELSYRSIQRFFADNSIPWLELKLKLFMISIFRNQKLILAVDETMIGKSGKKTYGIDYFFSSIYQKVMKSLCFSCISIIDVEKIKSYPLFSSQLVFTEEDKLLAKVKKDKTKKSKGVKRGRKKGSKNIIKDAKLAPSFRLVKEQLEICLNSLRKLFLMIHIVADSYYGNITFINICNNLGLLLISKLQNNASLHYKYDGKYSGSGRPKIYGDKIDFKNLPLKYLVSTNLKDDILTANYQIKCMHKQFKREINVVIVIKENNKTKKSAHTIFFSTDLNLSADEMLKYYSSRFQIEFNFRDAKEFFGLEDFMNTTETGVNNASNLAFFMVLFSEIRLQKFREKNNNYFLSIRDLISTERANRYIFDTLKLITDLHPNILIPNSFDSITSLGRINS